MEILRIEDLSFKYPNSDTFAVDRLSLSVENGEFITVCGESGCGKSTLLRLIKREVAPFGEVSGSIYLNGALQSEISYKDSACDVGFVMQDPDNQIVTDKVWHELAFGLENMGLPNDVIRRRVGEMASYFGIEGWFRRGTDELSGGQKQILNLASVMVMQPKLLILDEPTSQLDPIAAAEFVSTLSKLNRELGMTIIIVEHRLEELFPISDRVLLMDNGRALICDTPRALGKRMSEDFKEHPMWEALPSATRIFNALSVDGECPLTVKEGRAFLERRYKPFEEEKESKKYTKNAIVELKDVFFRYEREASDVLRGASMAFYEGEIACILGGNGSGKTTALNLISGILKPQRGKILIKGKKISSYKGNSLYRDSLAYLLQDPKTAFFRDTVRDELLEMIDQKIEGDVSLLERIAETVGIDHLFDRHPFDLSGGEQQKCALAKVLLTRPEVLLLDEPTKGLDASSKKTLVNILKTLKKDGITVLLVTHDVEFAALCADRCLMFFDGEVISEGEPREFFADNNFYTTAANRMARSLWKNAVTCESVVECCLKGGAG